MEKQIDLYKSFMEGLLENRDDLYAKQIKEGRAWPNVEMYAGFNRLYNGLNDDNKAVLVEIIQRTRDTAIFDVLEYIDDKINLGGLHITQNDIEFPSDFFGGDFHSDWAALCQGDLWGESKK